MRKARWDSGPFLFLFKNLTFGSHFGVAYGEKSNKYKQNKIA
jgi:hypothetical protein